MLHNKKKYKKHFFIIAALLICSPALSACGTNDSFDGTFSVTDYAMGTTINQTIYASSNASEADMSEISEDIMSVLNELEYSQLSWRIESSAIAKINSLAGTGEKVELTGSLDKHISEVLKLSKLSNGALDPTIGKITRLWDIGGDNPHIPDKAALQEELADTGYEHLVYCTAPPVSTLAIDDKASIDLGAVGKGIGCDNIYTLLSSDKLLRSGKAVCDTINGSVIAVGGSILVYGHKTDGSDWKIAISNPRPKLSSDYLGILSLAPDKPVYISTSGDYEKYFEENGVRYHHIIDPATGYPSDSGLISVTIVCQNGLISDGLSTACFVLGLEKSMPLLEEYNAEAIFVDSDYNVTMTDGIKDSFEIISSAYK